MRSHVETCAFEPAQAKACTRTTRNPGAFRAFRECFEVDMALALLVPSHDSQTESSERQTFRISLKGSTKQTDAKLGLAGQNMNDPNTSLWWSLLAGLVAHNLTRELRSFAPGS